MRNKMIALVGGLAIMGGVALGFGGSGNASAEWSRCNPYYPTPQTCATPTPVGSPTATPAPTYPNCNPYYPTPQTCGPRT
jgi:heme A synthase